MVEDDLDFFTLVFWIEKWNLRSDWSVFIKTRKIT